MDRFYSAVLKDEILADFFIDKLGDEMISDEWRRHLDLLRDFWSSMILEESGYRGNLVEAHADMALTPVEFERWLKVFHYTLDCFYTPLAALHFKQISQRIAENLMKRLVDSESS